ncbi:MAG: hypothetical protein EBR82_63390 [Caulobacteraceae bacterium]|nr:hypothetical protein [Caulobacteraceae bacterium]
MLMHNPTSVLDIGIGHGINGAGVRNWLDVGVQPYKTQLEGIEGWERYKSPLWECYDKVHICTIQDYIERYKKDKWHKFDCILMTDVIEHFDKDEGNWVKEHLERMLHLNGVLIISTPGIWIEQGDAYGNELERHRSVWHFTDFLNYEIIDPGTKPDDMGYIMLTAKYTRRS